MGSNRRDWKRRLWQTMGSLRTGIVLLILVGIAVFVGTIVMQRPINEANKLHQAYSPEVLRWLDLLGLTDVFHSWWFALLLALLSANIVVASLERWPVVWKYFARPYRRAEPHFLASLSMQREIVVRDEAAGIEAAEAAFRAVGLQPQRVVKGSVSLYAEKFRFARLAPFVVHASLLLIFAGAMIDGIWGFRGYIALVPGETGGQLEMRDGTRKPLSFALRCDATGQENYADGSPKRWWSKLAVIDHGQQVKAKEISVNNPLDYKGVRFFQANFGPSGEVAVKAVAVSKADQSRKPFDLSGDKPVAIDDQTTVRMAQFVPDFEIVGNQIQTRSQQLNNPAFQLVVKNAASAEIPVWVFPKMPEFKHSNPSSYDFEVSSVTPLNYTGLEASYEPGQWGVWAGVLLMGVALALVFYFVHIRFWAVPVDDGRGRLVLWVGASASKNRDEVEERFNRLVREIENNLDASARARQEEREPALASD